MADRRSRHITPKSRSRINRTGHQPRPNHQTTNNHQQTTSKGGHAGKGGKRPTAPRTVDRSGCRNPDVRKGAGAVIFALGFPAGIAGVILTVVAATDNSNDKKYPEAFSAVGPVLLVLAVIMFLVGFSLLSPLMSKAIQHCFNFDNPNGFCRTRCPRLSHFLKPDNSITINRAAMNALKSEPGKSSLKRPLTGQLSSELQQSQETIGNGELGQSTETLSEQISNGHQSIRAAPRSIRGVRFSESDADDVRRPRAASATSASSSVVSLRHCKVQPDPTDNIWYTDEVSPGQKPANPAEQETTEL